MRTTHTPGAKPRIILTAVLLAGSFTIASSEEHRPGNFGRIIFTKGDVTHTQPFSVVNPPAKGSRFYSGDVFTTGEYGFVSLGFDSGATVNIQPGSRVSVADIDCEPEAKQCQIVVSAERGEVHSEVTSQSAANPPVNFKVFTPFLSAAVRGTAFYVDVDQAVDTIGVTHGLVATSSNGTTNNLPKGKGMKAGADQQPIVVDLLPPPELGSDSTCCDNYLLSKEDTVRWGTVASATKYRVVLATDPSMANPVFTQEVESATLNIDNTPGKYFLTISAIDDQDMLGLPVMTEVTLASVGDAEPPELVIFQEGDDTIVSAANYSAPIELQLSNSLDGIVVSRQQIKNSSESISLQLDPDKDWVFKARKVLGKASVSLYSNEYVLKALSQ